MTEDQHDSQSAIARIHLLTGAFDAHIDRVEAHRVTLQPAQQAPRHFHAGGVIGYVEDGDILFEIEGQPATTLHKGSVFYEPPNAIITHFDNASDTVEATFIAFYPLSGNQALIAMTDQNQ
jgi:quercetin dioxygenase-like cupin family protein